MEGMGGCEGKEGRGGRGEKKGLVEGVEGRKGGMKGRERAGVGMGAGAPPPHDLFALRLCQYSGSREASFELSNATICPHGSKLWCSDLATDNALRGLKNGGEIREGMVGF